MVSLLAKGCKRKKSPFFADCQPFRLLDILYRKKSGLSLLTASQTLSLVTFTASNKQFCAYYINELYYRLIQQDQDDEAFFQLYLQTLDALQDEADIEKVLRLFELKLINLLGFELNHLISSLDTNHDFYSFDPVHFQFSASAPKESQNCFARDDLQAIASRELTAENKRVFKQFNRLIIHQLLGGRALKSRELFMK